MKLKEHFTAPNPKYIEPEARSAPSQSEGDTDIVIVGDDRSKGDVGVTDAVWQLAQQEAEKMLQAVGSDSHLERKDTSNRGTRMIYDSLVSLTRSFQIDFVGGKQRKFEDPENEHLSMPSASQLPCANLLNKGSSINYVTRNI